MEELPHSPEATIQLPSRLRIMQRLGQVTTSAVAKGNLQGRIASHAKEMFTPEEFVEMLAGHMHEYAEEHAMGIGTILFNRMPSYITTILDKERDKRQALQYWTDKVETEKGSGSAIDNAITNGQPHHRPRIYRSQRQSAQASSSRGEFLKPSARRQPWQR